MHWFEKYAIILASASPRRAELLQMAGFNFTVQTREVDESFPPDIPVEDVAQVLARRKALAQQDWLKEPNELLIAADSVVLLDQQILGKPADAIAARSMLNALSDRKHQVITGVFLLSLNKQLGFSVCSEVFMEKLTPEEIDYYITHYQPYDKAGSYGIQEWIGLTRISRIEGSYSNIMGLPMYELFEALKQF